MNKLGGGGREDGGWSGGEIKRERKTDVNTAYGNMFLSLEQLNLTNPTRTHTPAMGRET